MIQNHFLGPPPETFTSLQICKRNVKEKCNPVDTWKNENLEDRRGGGKREAKWRELLEVTG